MSEVKYSCPLLLMLMCRLRVRAEKQVTMLKQELKHPFEGSCQGWSDYAEAEADSILKG